MISTGKSSGYLNRCSEVAESFSDTFDQNLRSGGSSGIWSKPSERFNLQANGNCVKRICELPVNNWERSRRIGNCPLCEFKPKTSDPDYDIGWLQLCAWVQWP